MVRSAAALNPAPHDALTTDGILVDARDKSPDLVRNLLACWDRECGCAFPVRGRNDVPSTRRRCQGWPRQAGTKDTQVNNRRCFTFLAVAAALASGFGLHGATAQDWPTRPVAMVVPFAAQRLRHHGANSQRAPVGGAGPAGGHRAQSSTVSAGNSYDLGCHGPISRQSLFGYRSAGSVSSRPCGSGHFSATKIVLD